MLSQVQGSYLKSSFKEDRCSLRMALPGQFVCPPLQPDFPACSAGLLPYRIINFDWALQTFLQADIDSNLFASKSFPVSPPCYIHAPLKETTWSKGKTTSFGISQPWIWFQAMWTPASSILPSLSFLTSKVEMMFSASDCFEDERKSWMEITGHIKHIQFPSLCVYNDCHSLSSLGMTLLLSFVCVVPKNMVPNLYVEQLQLSSPVSLKSEWNLWMG